MDRDCPKSPHKWHKSSFFDLFVCYLDIYKPHFPKKCNKALYNRNDKISMDCG